VKEVMDAMEQDATQANLPLKHGTTTVDKGEGVCLKVDGGMTSNEPLMQFQADLLGIPLRRPRSAETTALGAAFAAGLGVGYWTSLAQLKQVYTAGKQWEAQTKPEERSRQLHNWKKAVSRSLGWIEGKLE